jgi:hypothetical protein
MTEAAGLGSATAVGGGSVTRYRSISCATFSRW